VIEVRELWFRSEWLCVRDESIGGLKVLPPDWEG
jgi:hypothetical protein